jgi:hypothetical protein
MRSRQFMQLMHLLQVKTIPPNLSGTLGPANANESLSFVPFICIRRSHWSHRPSVPLKSLSAIWVENILQHSQGGFPGHVWRIQVLQHNTNQIKTREKLSPKPADTAQVGALERYIKAATMLELQASQPLR